MHGSVLALGIVASLVLAACGGGGAAPTAGSTRSTVPGATAGGQPTAGQPTAAPGGGQPTPAQGGGQAVLTGPDVCKLIPDAAWAALDAGLKITTTKNPDDLCSRETADGMGSIMVEVTVSREQIKSMNTVCGTAQKISGIGDEAIWCPGLKILAVYANGQTVQVQMALFGSNAGDAAALAAGQAFVTAILPFVPKYEAPNTGAADNKACSLLTQQELQAALGEPFDAPVSDSATAVGGLSCTFERTNAIGSVVTRLYEGTQRFDSTKSAFKDAVDVPGIGDRAYWTSDLNVLSAVCNGKTMDVQLVFVQQSDPVKMRTAAEALGKAACSRV
jgi:hypothetical protein